MHTANRQWFGKLVLKGIAQSYWTKQHVTIKIVKIVLFLEIEMLQNTIFFLYVI